MGKGTIQAKKESVANVTLQIEESSEVEEVVIGYRTDGELHELAQIEPPVKATIQRK